MTIRELSCIRPFYDGDFHGDGVRQAVVNPHSGKIAAEVIWADADVVDRAVNAAAAASGAWAGTPAHRRAAILQGASEALQARRRDAAEIVSEQMGKALQQSLVEVDRAVHTLRLSAEEATRLSGEVPAADAMPGGEGVLAFWVRRPVGVVAAITPFNAPVNLACHKLGPSLAAGNTVVWKTPPQVPGVGPILAQAFQDAGLPAGALNVLHGGAEAGIGLVKHPLVRGVSFTGSVPAGRAIQSIVGLRPILLELGGISFNIIHHDADLARAAAACVAGAFKNSGQSCNSVQRVFIQKQVWDETVRRLVDLSQAQVVGDPLDERTDVGPVVSEAAAERIESWIAEAVKGGATVLVGGQRSRALLTPAVVADVPPNSRLACQEIFGPVFTVELYEDIEEVFRIADELPFGLSHAIFTKSLPVALRAATFLPSGTVMVNRNSNARLDHLPFGGVRESGLGGREGPRYAMEAMTEMHLVVIEP